MQRRNFFKLNQGCDPKTCTNCSCEGCKNNKLGQYSSGQAPDIDPDIYIPEDTTDTRPDRTGAYTTAPKRDPDIYIPGEPGTQDAAIPKGLSTVQAVLVTGFLIGMLKFVLDSSGKKLKLGRCK